MTSAPGRLSSLVVLAGWVVLLAVLLARGARGYPSFDFLVFWYAAGATATGASLYTGDDVWHGVYLYSPVFAVLLWPLARLGSEVSFAIWNGLSALAIVVSGVLFQSAQRAHGWPVSSGGILIALVILVVPLASNFRHGNSNSFLLLLFALALWWESRQRSTASGAMLALATAIKVSPGLFLAWFIARRNWRACTGFLLGAGLWMVVVPGLCLGPGRAIAETREWLSFVVWPGVTGEPKAEVLRNAGCSLPQLARAVWGGATTKAASERGHTLPPEAGSGALVVGAVAAGLVLVSSLVVATRVHRRHPSLAFGLVAAAMLLGSPTSRSAHFMLLLPLLVALLSLATCGEKRVARLARLGLVLGTGAMGLLVGLGEAIGVSSKSLFPVTALSLIVWGAALVVGLRLGTERTLPGTQEKDSSPEGGDDPSLGSLPAAGLRWGPASILRG